MRAEPIFERVETGVLPEKELGKTLGCHADELGLEPGSGKIQQRIGEPGFEPG